MNEINQYTIVVGKRGVITLPAKIREELGISDGTALKVVVANGEISIKPIKE